MDRLTRNAMLAKQAGMSYGKWKAMQPIVPIAEKKASKDLKVCPWCGEKFETSGKKIYCGDFCREQHYYKKNKERLIKYMKEYKQKKKEAVENGL